MKTAAESHVLARDGTKLPIHDEKEEDIHGLRGNGAASIIHPMHVRKTHTTYQNQPLHQKFGNLLVTYQKYRGPMSPKIIISSSNRSLISNLCIYVLGTIVQRDEMSGRIPHPSALPARIPLPETTPDVIGSPSREARCVEMQGLGRSRAEIDVTRDSTTNVGHGM